MSYTMTMEPEVVTKAERFALRRGTSLEKLVKMYVIELSLKDDIHNAKELSTENKLAELDSIFGSANVPEKTDYRDLVTEAILEKYYSLG